VNDKDSKLLWEAYLNESSRRPFRSKGNPQGGPTAPGQNYNPRQTMKSGDFFDILRPQFDKYEGWAFIVKRPFDIERAQSGGGSVTIPAGTEGEILRIIGGRHDSKAEVEFTMGPDAHMIQNMGALRLIKDLSKNGTIEWI
tara:strand:- start:43 stop:465 length:423 start_codon:yes stop_codon:yes gene_type:complete